MKYTPIKFPRDVKPHNEVLEWWYFNGHLEDSRGNKYSFMDCLFKVDSKKIKLPIIRRIPSKNFYFAHYLLSDISNKKFHSDITPFVVCSKNSFTKSRFYAEYTFPRLNYSNCEMEEIGDFSYRIKTGYFDLILKSKKKPLKVGGNGFVETDRTQTYYYSLTDLETVGEIILDGKIIKVSGKSWMDHQWANTPYDPEAGWTWFSLQLENNVEVLCYEFNFKKKFYLASMIDQNGAQKTTSQVLIQPQKNKWTSPKTGASCELDWNIQIPEFAVDVNVEPFIKNQEIVYGNINYWEGPLRVRGTYDHKKIKGLGFMELVGRPMTRNMINQYRLQLKDLFKQEKENLKSFLNK